MKSPLIILAVAMIVASPAIVRSQDQNGHKPNFTLFIADDCSYYDLGVYGSKDSRTPNIDKFATEGMLFTKCYQAAPMCSPTRHNLYTGIWPVKTGAYPNHTAAKEGTKSIAHHLKGAGYRVALVGKTHIQPKSVFPFEYIPLLKNRELNFAAMDTFMTACIKSGTPFCMIVASNQPHTPWNKGDASSFDATKVKLPPFYVDIRETREEFCKYLAEVNYMDGEFGKTLNLIDDHRQKDNTVVVYLSEQGNSLPFAKWTCYDAGVHSACIIRWPSKVRAGSVSTSLIQYVDITPTFVDIAGVKPAGKMDGKSFLPTLLNPELSHGNYAFSLQTSRGIFDGPEHYGIRSVTDGKYRYIINLTPETAFDCAMTKGALFQKWTEAARTDEKAKNLVSSYRFRPAIEFYDVDTDPYCMTNLAQKPGYQKLVKRFDKELRKWMAYCGDKGQATEMEAFEHMPRMEEEE